MAASGMSPQVDTVFKRLFGDEENAPLLVDLLNSVVSAPPGKGVTGVELVNPATDADLADSKVSVYDVKARDQAGRQYNVEMQRRAPWVFPKRLLLYWAKLHASQSRAGDFHQTLQPTYSVCFLGSALFDGGNHHHVFRLADERGLIFSGDVEVHTVELTRFALSAEELVTPLDRWCYFLKHGADLDLENLPASLNTPAIVRALGVLMTLSQSEIEWHRYQSRLMVQTDIESELAGVREESVQKGALIGRIQMCQRRLKQPLAPESELLKLSPDELTRLADELEERLFGSSGASSAQEQPPG